MRDGILLWYCYINEQWPHWNLTNVINNLFTWTRVHVLIHLWLIYCLFWFMSKIKYCENVSVLFLLDEFFHILITCRIMLNVKCRMFVISSRPWLGLYNSVFTFYNRAWPIWAAKQTGFIWTAKNTTHTSLVANAAAGYTSIRPTVEPKINHTPN